MPSFNNLSRDRRPYGILLILPVLPAERPVPKDSGQALEVARARRGEDSKAPGTRGPRAFRSPSDGLSSGLLKEARDPDQDDRSDKGDDDRTDHAPVMPDAQHPKNPATHHAPEKTQDNVHEDAVAATLHYLASQPTRNQPSHDPSEKAHMIDLLWLPRERIARLGG